MAVHPGMMIKPELEERGISQKQFAEMLGVQASHLSEVLNGKRALTAELAAKIEKAIGLPAKMLLSAQAHYDLESTDASKDGTEQETVALTIPIKDRNLLRELVRRFGWACVFWYSFLTLGYNNKKRLAFTASLFCLHAPTHDVAPSAVSIADAIDAISWTMNFAVSFFVIVVV